MGMLEDSATIDFEERSKSVNETYESNSLEGDVVRAEEDTLHTADPAIESASLSSQDRKIIIRDQDILFGRGGFVNRHFGNIKYRDIVSCYRKEYIAASLAGKPHVAKRVVELIRKNGPVPGRFLKRAEGGSWIEVSDREAASKVSQALREKTRWNEMKKNYSLDDERSTFASNEIACVNDIFAKKRKPQHRQDEINMDKFDANTSKQSSVVSVLDMDNEGETVPAEQCLESVQRALSFPSAFQLIIPPMAPLQECEENALSSSLSKFPASGTIIPSNDDILFGRGGRTNQHPGNKRLRDTVDLYRVIYQHAKKTDKPKVAKAIVSALKNHINPSRFLRMNERTNKWEDVGDRRATEKVSQALREKEHERKKRRVYTETDL